MQDVQQFFFVFTYLTVSVLDEVGLSGSMFNSKHII